MNSKHDWHWGLTVQVGKLKEENVLDMINEKTLVSQQSQCVEKRLKQYIIDTVHSASSAVCLSTPSNGSDAVQNAVPEQNRNHQSQLQHRQ